MLSKKGCALLQTSADVDLAFMTEQVPEPTRIAVKPLNIVVTACGVNHIGLATGDFQDMTCKIFN